jgi:hypothetical protein
MALASTRADYLDNIQRLATDVSGALDSSDYDAAINNAVVTYSRLRPLDRVQQYTSNGNRTFVFPDGWDSEISPGSQRVEYPVDTTADYPDLTEPEQIIIYRTPSGEQLRFRSSENNDLVPSSGDIFRLFYKGRHVFTTSEITVPLSHFAAFSKLEAAEALMMLATRVAQNGSAGITDGLANYQSKESSLTKLAEKYRKEAMDNLIEKSEEAAPAAGFFSMQQDDANRRPSGFFGRGEDGRKNIYD